MLSVSNQLKMWSSEPLKKIGFAVDGEFTFSGVEREPAFEWADGTFTDKLIGFDYPVVQDYVDENGEVHRQNQIVVRIEDINAPSFKFGDKLVFDGLGGYYSRKSKRYVCHAENVRKVGK